MADKNEWGSNLSFIFAMIVLQLGLEIYGDILMYFTQMGEEPFTFLIL